MYTLAPPHNEHNSPLELIERLTDNNKVLNYTLYTRLCELTQSEQIIQLFWMNAGIVYNSIFENRITMNGVWYDDSIYVHIGQNAAIIITHPLLCMTISNHTKDAVYTLLSDEPISKVITNALIPILKTLHKLLGIDFEDSVSVSKENLESVKHVENTPSNVTSEESQFNETTLNKFPPSLLAAKYGNEERIGRGKRKSKHDLTRLLLPYVDSEYDLLSLRTRNDIIWSRLKTFDITNQTIDGACLVNAGLDTNGQTIYKIFTSKWHIVISPTKSSVNMLYVKLCIVSEDDVDDLRAIAAVIRKITNILDS